MVCFHKLVLFDKSSYFLGEADSVTQTPASVSELGPALDKLSGVRTVTGYLQRVLGVYRRISTNVGPAERICKKSNTLGKMALTVNAHMRRIV